MVLNGPPVDGCVAGVELPEVLPGLVDIADVCPNGLSGGLKVELDWLNNEFEEGAFAAAGWEVFRDWPNNDVWGLGSSGFCTTKPNKLPV